jgi:hypothetical protein
MNFNAKKVFLIGFVVVLLVGIPVTVYLLQKQQEVRSRAEKSTNITFSPNSSQSAPIQKQVGDTIPLDITVDPGQNLASFIKLEIQYDPSILATASANAFQVNTVAFPGQGEGPIYSPGKIEVTFSVGSDPTKAIQQVTKAATVTFKAIANTPAGTPTLVTFGSNTQVLSVGSSDQFSENVLSSATPATIVIGGAVTPSLSATPSAALSDTPIPTDTPAATVTLAPTDTPVPTSPLTTSTPTPVASGSATPGQPPVCNSLAVDRATTGSAPFAITFTANGATSDGTIGKVTFNFGDGQQSDVTTSGGIGTNAVNVQISHTYNNEGSFTASAILTGSNNQQSVPSAACQQTITVQSNTSTGGGGGSQIIVASPSASIAATGSTGAIIGIASVALAFILGGGLLFFIL